MHCMDHHGVYGTIFASMVMFLIYNNGKPSLGATQDARLATINHRLAVFYKKTTKASHPGWNSLP